MSNLYRRINVLFSVVLALMCIIGVWFGARSVASATDDYPISPLAPQGPAAPTQASLHNPGFDNHDWYFFHERYDSSYPDGPDSSGKPILPDDDNNNPDQIPMDVLQDWRLWYVRDTPLVQTFAESFYVHSVESVAIRTHDGDIHRGGLYQMVYDTTPCLLYRFEMYGRSQPDPGQNPFSELQVGINPLGDAGSPPQDPAVPSAFLSTVTWGTAHDYKRTFGPISVTAEARADKIAVFSYANARGGRRHAIVWDSGSFQEVTPAVIADPDNLPAPGGVTNVTAVPGLTSATINWSTTSNAIGQVFYRLHASGGTAVPGYTNIVFLPIVIGGSPLEWSASPLVKTATTVHSANLTNLLPGRTYEYRVVSRGVSGDVCTTWVSELRTFQTSPFR